MAKRTPYKSMKFLMLTSGISEEEPDIRLDISPTMKNITHDGHKYFRMDQSSVILPDGSQGGLYLRTDYGERLRAKMKTKENA